MAGTWQAHGTRHRWRHRLAALATALATAGPALGAGTGAAAPAPVKVDAAAQQTITGFGASGAWWTIDLQYFPRPVQEQLGRLLFSDQGIALSQYRWNIGGGGTGVIVPTDGESEQGPRNRAPDTFYQGPGRYDWSRDAGGTTFLRLAADHHVPDLIGFGVGGPAAFTSNGKSCGGNLTPGAEAGYADYLATVVAHARQSWHADVNYVSPINEPDYTRADCTQEGMAVPPAQRTAVITALHRALAAKAPGTRIIADESSHLGDQFLPETPVWLADPATAADTAALAHHTYDFPDSTTRIKARALAARYHKPL